MLVSLQRIKAKFCCVSVSVSVQLQCYSSLVHQLLHIAELQLPPVFAAATATEQRFDLLQCLAAGLWHELVHKEHREGRNGRERGECARDGDGAADREE